MKVMTYYMLLASEDINEDRIVCLSNDDEDINGYELCIGKEYKRWDGKFQFYYDQDQGSKETDYLVNDMSWFLVSEKLKAILDEMNTSIQYLPVQIKEKNSLKELKGYYVANILTVVNALCLRECTRGPGFGRLFRNIIKYAIYEKKVKGADIFKLGKGEQIPIFVSEKFKNCFEEHKLTGIDFLEIKVV